MPNSLRPEHLPCRVLLSFNHLICANGCEPYATIGGVQLGSHVAPLDLDSNHQGSGHGNVKRKIHTPFLNHNDQMTSKGNV